MPANSSEQNTGDMRIRYGAPAEKFGEAIPVGNGRLGAMVFGGTSDERLALNEDTLWSGGPHHNNNPKALAALPEVQRLIFSGKVQEAEELVQSDLMGRPSMMQAYQPLGDLRLHFPGHEDATDYRRELDLEQAIARVTYRVGDATHRAKGATFTREVFASYPAQLIVVRLTCDRPARLDVDVALTSPQPDTVTVTCSRGLRLTGKIGPTPEPDSRSWTAPWHDDGMRFESRVRIAAESGTVKPDGQTVQIRDADAVTLFIAAATSFRTFDDIGGDPAPACEQHLSAANTPYDQLRGAHVADYRSLFSRVRLEVPGAQSPELHFQAGRYLLIACSRRGSQAANLQGIWCGERWPYWGSKYTININIQMNYWPAEVANLPECHEPLLDLVRDLSVTGARTARECYGCGGFVTHHNTDLWRLCAAVDGVGTYWQTGGAWLATHLYEHYLFTGDEAFLRDRGYPLMREAARFFIESMVEVPEGLPLAGCLVTNPSSSPETGPSHAEGLRLAYGPTMDLEIIHHLLTACIAASEALGADEDFRRTLRQTLDRLPPLQVGERGQLQEWIGDWDDPGRNHHHVSHLYAVYPGSRIRPDATPELAAAARQSLLDRQMDCGGFPGAWRAALWARLGDGERAYEYVRRCGVGSRPHLFGGADQVDGPFGLTAGIAEMLLQSHGDCIHLLPALPEAWPDGRATGLRARGGFEVDIAWRSGALTEATVLSDLGGPCRLRYAAQIAELPTQAGGQYRFDGDLAALVGQSSSR